MKPDKRLTKKRRELKDSFGAETMTDQEERKNLLQPQEEPEENHDRNPRPGPHQRTSSRQ